jgi:hypothetical protein
MGLDAIVPVDVPTYKRFSVAEFRTGSMTGPQNGFVTLVPSRALETEA